MRKRIGQEVFIHYKDGITQTTIKAIHHVVNGSEITEHFHLDVFHDMVTEDYIYDTFDLALNMFDYKKKVRREQLTRELAEVNKPREVLPV